MDKQLDIRFDRVEKALGTLVDSIAKYNPSTQSAHDFVAADAELCKGLEELQTHQSNYRRLQELRAASSSLDAQIRDTLRLLANIRKELVNTPATIFPEDAKHYDINYDELLRYARMISKTTLPPASALNTAAAAVAAAAVIEPQGNTETTATTPGGTGTPNGTQSSVPPITTTTTTTAAAAAAAAAAASVSANGMPTPQQTQTTDPTSSQQSQQQQPIAAGASFATTATATTTATSLPEDLNAHLNPQAYADFAPWPGEDGVRFGSLAALAFLADRGVDPEGYDPEAERVRREEAEQRLRFQQQQREEEERERARREREQQQQQQQQQQQEEARERRAREEQQARLRAAEQQQQQQQQQRARERDEASEDAYRRSSVIGGAGSSPTTGEKKQFQFMGLDDDDD